MNDHQRQTEFLKRCILYDGSKASHKLVERIGQLQHNERCVTRAVWLMVYIGALALAGLGYLAVFMEDFPRNIPGFMTRFITQVFCVMGLSSLICVTVFLGLQAAYRKELAHRREDCRRLATHLLESRLARPQMIVEGQSQAINLAPAPDAGLGPSEMSTG
jgi:uncharacterized membrane protein YuzA (DUF378 family)